MTLLKDCSKFFGDLKDKDPKVYGDDLKKIKTLLEIRSVFDEEEFNDIKEILSKLKAKVEGNDSISPNKDELERIIKMINQKKSQWNIVLCSCRNKVYDDIKKKP